MKINIIDLYTEDSSPHKDPITIPQGLTIFGHDVELVTTGLYIKNSLFGFKVWQLSEWLVHGIRISNPDIVIAISRFNPDITPVLRVIKAARIPLIVKGDTDGTIGYPLPPNYLRARPITAHPFNIFRHIKWRAPISYLVKQRLEHVQLADMVVCESPGAASNLIYILNYWGLSELAKKVTLIPNSISKIVTESPLAPKKRRAVVSIGRWDDQWCKGADLLAGTISYLASRKHDVEFIVVGKNPDYVSKRLSKKETTRVCFTGQLDFEASQSLLSSVQVLLVPSRLESFSLVSGEALCLGTSLVVTPIESLMYLAGGGTYGTISRDFSVPAIAAALLYELQLWDHNYREPESIARFWRTTLGEKRIASIWANAIEKLLGCRN